MTSEKESREADVLTIDDRADVVVLDDLPEGLVEDLNLADHLKGYWPSSKNVTQ